MKVLANRTHVNQKKQQELNRIFIIHLYGIGGDMGSILVKKKLILRHKVSSTRCGEDYIQVYNLSVLVGINIAI